MIDNSSFDPTRRITIGTSAGVATHPAAAPTPTPPGATLVYSGAVTNSHYDANGISIARGAITGVLRRCHSVASTNTSINYAVSSGGADTARPAAAIAAAPTAHKVNIRLTDHDTDTDNRIAINTLAHLDAVRYGQDGPGDQDSAAANLWGNYTTAFPDTAPGMSCAAAGLGCEPTADLDFDTSDNGYTPDQSRTGALPR